MEPSSSAQRLLLAPQPFNTFRVPRCARNRVMPATHLHVQVGWHLEHPGHQSLHDTRPGHHHSQPAAGAQRQARHGKIYMGPGRVLP